jgi:AraC-like DNA-binding protein
MGIARQLLLSTDLTLQQIAHRSGFQNAFYLSGVFKKEHSVSPGDYRKQAGP